MQKTGFVIAFHNDEELHPYHGLTCKDRAIRLVKPHIPTEILSRLRGDNKAEFDRVRSRISLEAGITRIDAEVLLFIERKVANGDTIFLDLKRSDAKAHNNSEFSDLFRIVSIRVTLTEFELLDADYFSEEQRREIIDIVERSQGGALTCINATFQRKEGEVDSGAREYAKE